MTELELESIELLPSEDGISLLLLAPDGKGGFLMSSRPFPDLDPEYLASALRRSLADP